MKLKRDWNSSQKNHSATAAKRVRKAPALRPVQARTWCTRPPRQRSGSSRRERLAGGASPQRGGAAETRAREGPCLGLRLDLTAGGPAGVVISHVIGPARLDSLVTASPRAA